MNTKAIAVTIVFAALALALSPIRIPTLFWPSQYYRLWELPIIIAFLLFGFKIASPATVLYAAGYVLLLPDASGFVGFPWAIVLMLSVFLGLFLASKVVNRKITQQESRWKTSVIYFTAFGTLSRAAIMPFVDYGVYRFLLPFVIGHGIPDAYILGLMPAIVFFNITVPLYTIPIAYLVAKTAGKNLEIGNKL